MNHWSDAYCDVLRSALPVDLPPERPIYLATSAEAGPLAGKISNAIAYTSQLLDFNLKPLLESQGRWQGPGFSAVICRRSVIEGSLENALETLGHEISHCLVDEVRCQNRWIAGEFPTVAQAIADNNGPPVCVAELYPELTFAKWRSHELDFIRAALHMGHRLRAKGYWVTPPGMAVAGDSYGLSDGMRYREKLVDELDDQFETPITEILKMPFPEQFRDLWIYDTQSIIKL